MMKTNKHAFTLIELLIVVAIISIMAAILFPVFARARENARRTSCASNLKQIALGIMQYAQDNDERFPRPAPISGGPGNWATIVLPYIKSNQLFRCPSHYYNAGATVSVGPRNDYAYNVWYSWTSSHNNSPKTAGIALSTLTRPSLSVIVVENFQWDGRNWTSAAGDWRVTTDNGGGSADAHCSTASKCLPGLAQFQTQTAEMHLGGINYAFTDGHVKWYKSLNKYQSAVVWNVATPGSQSLDAPTFNPIP